MSRISEDLHDRNVLAFICVCRLEDTGYAEAAKEIPGLCGNEFTFAVVLCYAVDGMSLRLVVFVEASSECVGKTVSYAA